MSSTSSQKIEQVMTGLGLLKKIHIDILVDNLIASAVENGKTCIRGKEGKELHVKVGDDYEKIFKFGDCVGRFRTILARLWVRTRESNPILFDGDPYGFRSRVRLEYGVSKSAELLIETSNTMADIHLFIENV